MRTTRRTIRTCVLKALALVLLAGTALLCVAPRRALADQSSESILLSAFEHGKGWQTWTKSVTPRTTEGIGAIKIKLERPSASGDIVYRAYVHGEGWGAWCKNGEAAGTTSGNALLGAIQIKLTGQLAQKYDVWYRVQAQGFGMLDNAKNGQSAGTESGLFGAESVTVSVLSKDHLAPALTKNPFIYHADDTMYDGYMHLVETLAANGFGEFKNLAYYRFADVLGDDKDELLVSYKDSGGSVWHVVIYTYDGLKSQLAFDTDVYGEQSYCFYKDSNSLILNLSGHGGRRDVYYEYKSGSYRETMNCRITGAGVREYFDGTVPIANYRSQEVLDEVQVGTCTYLPASSEWSKAQY